MESSSRTCTKAPDRVTSEASDVTRSGALVQVREEDSMIGQLLVEAGAVGSQAVEEAFALQEAARARNAPVPRLCEILIERGVLTYATLQGVLQRQSSLI